MPQIVVPISRIARLDSHCRPWQTIFELFFNGEAVLVFRAADGVTELPVGGLNAPLQANFQLDGPKLSIHGHSDSHEVSLSLNRHGW